jgi:hypothetical protein
MKFLFLLLPFWGLGTLLPAQNNTLTDAHKSLMQDIAGFQSWYATKWAADQIGLPKDSPNRLNQSTSIYSSKSKPCLDLLLKLKQQMTSPKGQLSHADSIRQQRLPAPDIMIPLDQQCGVLVSICAGLNVDHHVFGEVVRLRMTTANAALQTAINDRDAAQKRVDELNNRAAAQKRGLSQQEGAEVVGLMLKIDDLESHGIPENQYFVEKCKFLQTIMDQMGEHVAACQNRINQVQTNLCAVIDNATLVMNSKNQDLKDQYQKSLDRALSQLFDIL